MSLTVPKTQAKKARIASQPARKCLLAVLRVEAYPSICLIALSDDSDVDRDEDQEQDRKKGTAGKQSNKTGRKSRTNQSLGKTGRRDKMSSPNHSSTSSVDELEVADDDSQTFAGFKMRVAAQEQVRVLNEREEKRSQKSKRPRTNIRAFIDMEADDDDDDPDSAKVIPSTSVMSQSVQISTRKRSNGPHFNMDESWPYPSSRYGPRRDEKDESEEEDAELSKGVNGKKTGRANAGKDDVLPDLRRPGVRKCSFTAVAISLLILSYLQRTTNALFWTFCVCTRRYAEEFQL